MNSLKISKSLKCWRKFTTNEINSTLLFTKKKKMAKIFNLWTVFLTVSQFRSKITDINFNVSILLQPMNQLSVWITFLQYSRISSLSVMQLFLSVEETQRPCSPMCCARYTSPASHNVATFAKLIFCHT